MLWTGALRIKARDIVMAGLNARGLQSKFLITPLSSEAIIIIIILQVWCSLKSLYMYSGYSSYHIGEPSLISKLLLPCVYDTMIMQFYY